MPLHGRGNYFGKSEYKLDQQHITDCTGTDAQQGVPLPDVQKDYGTAADGFRNAEGSGDEGNILQAVDHQHAHDGKGQDLSQVGDQGRGRPVFAEDQEGEEPESGGDPQNRKEGNPCLISMPL